MLVSGSGARPYKFTKRPNWLFQTKLNLAAREVYTVLLSHAWGGKATVFPSIKRIAEMAGIGRTTVKDALNTLESIGLIDIDRRPPAANRYTIRDLSGDLSEAEIEQICSLSRAEIATCEPATRTSRIPAGTSRIPAGTSRIPTVDRSDSGHEVYEHKDDELKEDKTRRRNTPPTPAASAERFPAGEETNPAYGRGQVREGTGAGSLETGEMPSVSSSNNMFPRPDDDFASLRAHLLRAKNGVEQR